MPGESIYNHASAGFSLGFWVWGEDSGGCGSYGCSQ